MRKMMGKIASRAAALSLAALLLAGCGGGGASDGIVMTPEAPEQTPYSFSMFSDDVLPIATFIPPVPAHGAGFEQRPGQINDEYYGLAAAAGINLVMGHFESDANVVKNLEMCEKHGMGYLLHTDRMDFYYMDENKEIVNYDEFPEAERERVKSAFLARVAEFADYPAFAGVHFVDEPGVDEFAGIAAAKRIFKEAYPDKIFYVNLMSQRAEPSFLQFGADFGVAAEGKVTDPGLTSGSTTDRYNYHVQEFVGTVSPDLLCFDLYPFTDLSGVPGHYVQNLNIIRKKAQENGLHFWNFMQVSQYAATAGGELRIPSKNELAWEINATLAYGGKGLAYFDFFCPPEFTTTQQGGGWRTSIMADGTVNEEYYSLVEVVGHVRAVDDILMKSKWKGVIQTAQSYDSFDYPDKTLERFNQLERATAQANFLIGCFNYGGKTALYVINNNIQGINSATLEFDREVIGTVWREGKRSQFRDDVFVVEELPAGYAAMIVLE